MRATPSWSSLRSTVFTAAVIAAASMPCGIDLPAHAGTTDVSAMPSTATIARRRGRDAERPDGAGRDVRCGTEGPRAAADVTPLATLSEAGDVKAGVDHH